MRVQPRFWITTFNLLMTVMAGLFARMILERNEQSWEHHWENDYLLASAFALVVFAGTALCTSFGSTQPMQLIWRKAQRVLAWTCYTLAFWAIMERIKTGLALHSEAPAWGNAISIIGIASISGICDALTRKYLR